MTAERIQFQDNRLFVDFAKPWSADDYELFLRTKLLPECAVAFDDVKDSYRISAPARFAHHLGIVPPIGTRPSAPVSEFLFDYQKWIVAMALEARRFCIWADCGLGKTPMALDFARVAQSREGGKWVHFTLTDSIVRDTTKQLRRFYNDTMPYVILKSREELKAWCAAPLRKGEPWLAFCTYHKLIPSDKIPEQVLNELRLVTGVTADESSILKTKGGVIKWALMKSTYGVPYKLSCTATPAPNDVDEYASQAGFLDKFNDTTTSGEAGATFFSFFKREKDGTQVLKPHARPAFFKFMSSWSIYLRKPSAFGFADPFAHVPEPATVEVKIEPTDAQLVEATRYQRALTPGFLIPQSKLGVAERSKLSQIAKGFVYEQSAGKKTARRIDSAKPKAVARLVRQALAAGHRPLIWTVFDEESEILMSHLQDTPIEALHGKMDEEAREDILERYAAGRSRGLISKASLLGYGLNFPFCECMIFSGFDDSFERFYQAVRRGYRYGATGQLTVYVPIVPGLEDHMWQNTLRKKNQWETDIAEQERNYVEALKAA